MTCLFIRHVSIDPVSEQLRSERRAWRFESKWFRKKFLLRVWMLLSASRLVQGSLLWFWTVLIEHWWETLVGLQVWRFTFAHNACRCLNMESVERHFLVYDGVTYLKNGLWYKFTEFQTMFYWMSTLGQQTWSSVFVSWVLSPCVWLSCVASISASTLHSICLYIWMTHLRTPAGFTLICRKSGFSLTDKRDRMQYPRRSCAHKLPPWILSPFFQNNVKVS